MADQPEGVYARIPIADLPLFLARGAVDDDSFWDETLPVVLAAYPQISLADYEQLTVFQHRQLVDAVAPEVPDGD